MTRYCEDCAHCSFKPGDTHSNYSCVRVLGSYKLCNEVRTDSGDCGPDAKHFVRQMVTRGGAVGEGLVQNRSLNLPNMRRAPFGEFARDN